MTVAAGSAANARGVESSGPIDVTSEKANAAPTARAAHRARSSSHRDAGMYGSG